jgi:hypothetical protein
MINDIDTQQIYGIMSMEDIEQMFTQIERRIGVHERDVLILEERCKPMTYDETFSQYMREHFARIDAQRAVNQAQQDAHWNKIIEWAAQKDREYRQFAEEQEQAEASKVISGETGGEDDRVSNS